MTIVTPGVVPASALVGRGRPDWLIAWGRFAADFRAAALPGEVMVRAKLVLSDTIGAIAAGMQEAEMRRLTDRLAPAGRGEAGSAVIGAGRYAAPAAAAFLNGCAGTMLELDEGNQYARGHPAIHVVPAALAAAERAGASGRDLLLAIVLGYEIGARIGSAAKLRVSMHPHGTWGTVGAALAAAFLDGADAERCIQAINLASSLGLTTSRRTMLEGATVRNAYAGISNQLGLLAFDLVAAGFTGETDGVGTVYGGIAAEGFQPQAMTEELGSRFEIARNYFKRHAACRYTHAALDALAGILGHRGGRLDPGVIERIEVDTYVWAAQLDWAEPGTMLAAKFSLPFALATALVAGTTDVAAFREPALSDPATRDLARRVVVREDPALTAMLPRLRPARLRIVLRGGEVVAGEALTNRGDSEDPYRPAELRDKFLALAGPVWGLGAAERLLAVIDAVDGPNAPAELFRLLAAAPVARPSDPAGAGLP